jgi:hypothetical protein
MVVKPVGSLESRNGALGSTTVVAACRPSITNATITATAVTVSTCAQK